MVKKYCIQQAGLLCLVAVIMILTNIIGYQMPLSDSIAGILVLCAIALFGLSLSKFMSRFIKLPSMMYAGSLSPITGQGYHHPGHVPGSLHGSCHCTWCICWDFPWEGP